MRFSGAMARPARWILAAGALAGGMVWTAAAAAPAAPPEEVIVVDPADTWAPPPATPDTAIPVAPAAEAGEEDTAEAGAADAADIPFGRTELLAPYYFSAYLPPMDRTEVDLGLLLGSSPGLQVALGWGALETLFIGTRMSAFGASHAAGLHLRGQIMPEPPCAAQPAVALVLGGTYLNHRTAEDEPRNVFRGNRIRLGFALSKDFGALARSLRADPAWIRFGSAFRLHAEALGEYQTGRKGDPAVDHDLGAFGARVALEMLWAPRRLHASLVWDTLPEVLEGQDVYTALRYFSGADLAVDAVVGLFQKRFGLMLTLAWLF